MSLFKTIVLALVFFLFVSTLTKSAQSKGEPKMIPCSDEESFNYYDSKEVLTRKNLSKTLKVTEEIYKYLLTLDKSKVKLPITPQVTFGADSFLFKRKSTQKRSFSQTIVRKLEKEKQKSFSNLHLKIKNHFRKPKSHVRGRKIEIKAQIRPINLQSRILPNHSR